MTLHPFYTSTPFRVLLGASSGCLVVGGLATALNLAPIIVGPTAFMLAAIAAVAAFFFAVLDHPKHAFFAVVTMPPAFFLGVCVMVLAISHPILGWLLAGAGMIPAALAVATTRTRASAAPSPATAAHARA